MVEREPLVLPRSGDGRAPAGLHQGLQALGRAPGGQRRAVAVGGGGRTLLLPAAHEAEDRSVEELVLVLGTEQHQSVGRREDVPGGGCLPSCLGAVGRGCGHLRGDGQHLLTWRTPPPSRRAGAPPRYALESDGDATCQRS